MSVDYSQSPWIVETQRLALRPFNVTDAQQAFVFLSDPLVSRYTGDGGRIHSVDDAKAVIQDVWLADYQRYGYGRYALVHKGDGLLIGFCGPKYLPDYNCTDLGYRMLPQYWRQGLASEAVSGVLPYIREHLGITRLVADVDSDNIASKRVLLANGFSYSHQTGRDEHYAMNV